MLDRGWIYPQAAVSGPHGDPGDPERDLVAGLARAERALAAIPAAVVTYDELIEDEAPLAAALRTLYGDVDLPEPPRYLDDGFRAVRDEVLARRRTARWRRLDALAGSL
jgi:hypothetical protein